MEQLWRYHVRAVIAVYNGSVDGHAVHGVSLDAIENFVIDLKHGSVCWCQDDCFSEALERGMVEISSECVVNERFMVAYNINAMMIEVYCGGVSTVTDLEKPWWKVWISRSTYVVFQRQVVEMVPQARRFQAC